MATRTLRATLPVPAPEVLRRLAAPETFPGYAPDLLSVDREGDRSDWVLAFRGGAARWTQTTRTLPDRIEFEQVDGDFTSYSGHWSVTPTEPVAPAESQDGTAEPGDTTGPEGGSTVEFTVKYRTSVPHLAGAVESAVGRVLSRTALAVLTGVGGPVRITSGAYFLADLPEGGAGRAV
uniref:Orf4 n=1 Tax=Micromonospora sp. SCSIO 07395 TaxID=2998119 RepID=A0A9E9J679_9ACTN|nr:Orf4 [Micromonospora sp. SCSIO 07395]